METGRGPSLFKALAIATLAFAAWCAVGFSAFQSGEPVQRASATHQTPIEGAIPE
jgi:hypothetical protein